MHNKSKATSPAKKEKQGKQVNRDAITGQFVPYDFDYTVVNKEDNKIYGLKEIRVKKIVRKLS